MSSPSYEDASRCPRCDIPGDHTSSTPAKNSRGKPVSIHMFYCRNENCRWFNTSWIVQVNPDGTIPDPNSDRGVMHEKAFPKMPAISGDEERIIKAVERQVAQETQPGGGEIGGRR